MQNGTQIDGYAFAPWSLMTPDPAQSKAIARTNPPSATENQSARFKDILAEADAKSATNTKTAMPEDEGHMFGEDGFDLGDALDIINPLQHLPVISTIYREITGDTIEPGARLAGGAIFGGPLGFASALLNNAVESHTGQDIGETVIATLFGEEGTLETPVDGAVELASAPTNQATRDPNETISDTAPLMQDALALNALLAQHFGKNKSPASDDDALKEEGEALLADDQNKDPENHLPNQDELFDQDLAFAAQTNTAQNGATYQDDIAALPENMLHLLNALEGRNAEGTARSEPQREQSFTSHIAASLSQEVYRNTTLKRPLSIAEMAAEAMNKEQNISFTSLASGRATIQSASLDNPFRNTPANGALSLDAEAMSIVNNRVPSEKDIPSAMALALQKYKNAETLS